jgi:O-methyltransferase involved in polyketide biosynthesis
MIEAKRAIINEMLPHGCSNLDFAAVDVLSLDDLLVAKSRLARTPIALIHEGLFTYFPHEQKKQIAANFRALLAGRGGVWVTPDIITREQLDRTTSLSKEYLTKWPTFYPFENKKEAMALFNDAGFTVEQRSPLDLVPRLKSEVPDERVREILAHEELWIMRPC